MIPDANSDLTYVTLSTKLFMGSEMGISGLNGIKDTWLEYGLQGMHENKKLRPLGHSREIFGIGDWWMSMNIGDLRYVWSG
jgi:hypothetical protein